MYNFKFENHADETIAKRKVFDHADIFVNFRTEKTKKLPEILDIRVAQEVPNGKTKYVHIR